MNPYANNHTNRFSNTLANLKDCFKHLHESITPEEDKARDDLALWCKLTFDDWSDYLPKNYGVDVGEVIDE